MTLKKGDRMIWKNTGELAYEKVDDNDFGFWSCLFSKRLVEYSNVKTKEKLSYSLSETELPVNERFGFRWTDAQVFDYYKEMMDFKTN